MPPLALEVIRIPAPGFCLDGDDDDEALPNPVAAADHGHDHGSPVARTYSSYGWHSGAHDEAALPLLPLPAAAAAAASSGDDG